MKEPADLFLYRHRYLIGYGLLIILFAFYLIIAGLFIPGGLTQSEIDMVGITNQIDFSDLSSLAITNLPIHLLQLAIFSLLGVSIITIKLPSIILAIISGVAIFSLLRRWFKPSVSILSLLLVVSTSQFTYAAQSFTPHILYILYSALILLFASLIFQKAKPMAVWKICLIISMALSLFTPYFWFINLGLVVVALIHPHTRHFILRKKYIHQWFPAMALFAAILVFVLYLSLISTDFLSNILGIANLQIDILPNTITLIRSYLWADLSTIGGQITPLIDFGVLIIILLGLIQTIRQRQSARSYMIIAWVALSLPLLILNPSLNAIMTVPAFVLLVVGIETLLHEWYKLFPKNPYARGVGLIMTILVISTLTLTSIDTFINSYRHFPEAVNQYNTDLPLLARASLADQATLVVSQQEKPLYEALVKHNDTEGLSVTTEAPINLINQTIISHESMVGYSPPDNSSLSHIVNNGRREKADRFYIYDMTTE